MKKPGPMAQVNGGIVVKALKARNTGGASKDGFMSRLQRFGICRQVTWGVAPGCCIPHLGADA